VRRVVDALGDLPHILFEISNECANTAEAWAWQYRMLEVAKRHLASRGFPRPVGITASAGWLGDRDLIAPRLASSAADWTSPDGEPYKTNPPPADGAKVSIVDSDHVWGLGGQSVDWCWQVFTRGHNLLSMDSLKTPDVAGRSFSNDTTPEQAAGEDAAREGIRQTRMAAEMVDLRGVRARGDLSSTGFAIADPVDGDFVVYAPKGGAFTLDLSGARGKRLAARWVDTGAGTVSEGGVVEGGSASQSFAAPAGRAAALVLRPADRPRR
jgi:collagenase-like protein with putative collagen-binding domain